MLKKKCTVVIEKTSILPTQFVPINMAKHLLSTLLYLLSPYLAEGQIICPNTCCQGATIQASIQMDTPAQSYIWLDFSGGTRINGQYVFFKGDSLSGKQVELRFEQPYDRLIQVWAIYPNDTIVFNKTIIVNSPIIDTVFPEVYVCQCTYTLPWGIEIKQSGDYKYIFQDSGGCFLIQKQKVNILPGFYDVYEPKSYSCTPIFTNPAGDIFWRTGEDVCFGSTILSNGACQHHRQIQFQYSARSKIRETDGVYCTQLPDTLYSQYTQYTDSIHWLNQARQIISKQPYLVVSDTGWYYLHVFDDLIYECDGFDSVYVKVGTAPSIDIVTKQPYSCQFPQVMLFAQPDTADLRFEWYSDKWTYKIEADSVLIDKNLKMTLVGTDTISGCKTVLSRTINKNTAQVDIVNDPIPQPAFGCADTLLSPIDIVFQPPNAFVTWYHPNGNIVNNNQVNIDDPGTYSILAIHPTSGCRTLKTVDAIQKKLNGLTPIVVPDKNNTGSGIIKIIISEDNNITWSSIFYKDSLPIGTGNQFYLLSAGTYSWYYQQSNGCDTTLYFTIENVVATYEQGNNDTWFITPNPTNGTLYFKTSEHNSPIEQIHLIDWTGKTIWSHTPVSNTDFSVQLPASLSAGTYLLTYEYAGRRSVKRLMLTDHY